MACVAPCRRIFCDRLVQSPGSPSQAWRNICLSHSSWMSALPPPGSKKYSQDTTADVVTAWRTPAGLQPGRWYQRCLALHPQDLSNTIFENASGVPRTSETFFRDHLLPLIHQQCLKDDPYLTPYSGQTPEPSLAYVFYSIDSYKKGGQLDASLKRPISIHKATLEPGCTTWLAATTMTQRWRNPTRPRR